MLHISLHQHRLFPLESGELSEIGGESAEGYNINVPLPSGTGNGGYIHALQQVATPAIRRFKPEIIFVSNGFDPSALDPLGCMTVTSDGFRMFAHEILGVADEVCGGRAVFAHEGGYSPVHVPFCGVAVLEELSGARTDVVDPFGVNFDNSPAHELLPHQAQVVEAAAAVVQLIK